MKDKIGIFGTGKFGFAIGKILLKKNKNIDLSFIYINNKATGFKNEKIDHLQTDVKFDFIFVCINSDGIINYINQIAINTKAIILCSKSLVNDEDIFFSRYIKNRYNNIEISILSGPGFANEILQNKKTLLNFASSNYHSCLKVVNYFQNSNIIIKELDHVESVEFFGAMKNVLSIIFSYLKAKKNNNAAVADFMIILKDLQSIISILEVRGDFFFESCGIGDLLLTITSVKSRNNKFGRLLHHGDRNCLKLFLDQNTIEGYKSMQIVYKLIIKKGIKTELLGTQIESILNILNE